MHKPLVLAAPAEASANGTAQTVNPRSGLVLGLHGTFTATVQPQWSPSDSSDVWHDWGGPLTAPDFVMLPPGRARRVRLRTTAYTSGAPAATLLADEALEAMRPETTWKEIALEVKGSVAQGAPAALDDAYGVAVSVFGTFTATLRLQFSPAESGDVWYNWGTPLAAAGRVWLPAGMARRVRIATTAYTSGSPTATANYGFAQEQLLDEAWIETVTAGALSLYARTSLISVTGTQAYTLPKGTHEGQRKSVRVTVAASTPDGTLTPAAFADGTSLDLDAVGESAELEWHDAGGWRLVNLTGATINA
jgi:hypothetical protein